MDTSRIAAEVSMTSLDTSRIAVKTLGESAYQQESCTVSRKSLETSRMAVKSLGRFLVPA